MNSRNVALRGAGGPLATVALLTFGLAPPGHADTFGSIHCDTVTSIHNRVLKVCAQVALINGRVQAQVSVHWLDGSTPRREYAKPPNSITGGVVWLLRDGTYLNPASSLNCGQGGYPACAGPTNGYSLWDPNPAGANTYRAQITADVIRTFDDTVTNVSVLSLPVTI